ncbi:hypothetical protein [Thioalkalivibrio sp. XN8]|uniref:hypothetical protein n=1 Tax=Thioalkalivibrio sp. XN8 TaxID=2712863 RepID=UPI0013EBAA6B|nr:hypothetical protein [Thioalkalivibrio sp. XN8]NGP54109.1 hypothetical protein [Thioalkalivibrio sp. XN8]
MSCSRLTTLLLCATGALLPAAAAAADTRFVGDVRLELAASEQDTREGESLPREEELRARLRLGLESQLAEEWLGRIRLAGRYGTEQDRSRFWLKAWAPTPTGLELGDTTIDELYLHYHRPGSSWSLRAGRFQGEFVLDGVAAKSLDRYNSPETEISWTDGLHLTYGLDSAWRSHLVLQSNASSGSGQAARPPLAFDDDASQVTMFAALEAAEPLGPLTQRVFAVTWMPSTLAADGLAAPARDDYLALTAKLFAEWPIAGMRGGVGIEYGYAPTTPAGSLFNPAATGDANGEAWQATLSLWDFIPGHAIGYVHGRVDAGWLLSPDFGNGEKLYEIRYQWRVSSKWTMEAALRQRQEIKVPADAEQVGVVDDFYIRFTTRF